MSLKDTRALAPKRIKFELVREVAGEDKPVVIAQTTVKKTAEIVYFPKLKPVARGYFVKSIIRRTKNVPKYFLFGTKEVDDFVIRCNAYYSESLESETEVTPQYSSELASLLLADDMIQHIEAVEAAEHFQIDSALIKLIGIVFGMSIPFGFLMLFVFGAIPNQVVVWSA